MSPMPGKNNTGTQQSSITRPRQSIKLADTCCGSIRTSEKRHNSRAPAPATDVTFGPDKGRYFTHRAFRQKRSPFVCIYDCERPTPFRKNTAAGNASLIRNGASRTWKNYREKRIIHSALARTVRTIPLWFIAMWISLSLKKIYSFSTTESLVPSSQDSSSQVSSKQVPLFQGCFV